jgi:methionyl-tRNA formyltransferase
MVVEEALDTGGIYARVELAIGVDETADQLRARLVEAGTRLVVEQLSAGLGAPVAQEGEPTYAAKIEPAELQIDWNRPAVEIHRLVRVGGAWTTHLGRRLKVHRTALPPRGTGPVIETGDGAIELVEVQPEGKARMIGPAWANGARWRPGDRLGT